MLQHFPTLSEIPEDVRPKTCASQRDYLIDGQIRTWDAPTFPVISPIRIGTGQPAVYDETLTLGHVPMLTKEVALEALNAAVKAWDKGRGAWPTSRPIDRIHAVEKFAALMQEKREEVVHLLMWEIGKPLADSYKEFDRTVAYIHDTCQAYREMERQASTFTSDKDIIAQVRRSPLGVTLCMGPFNYPLNETYTTLIPALIMGNPVIVKTPKYGILLHQPLLEAFQKAFPKGVVNFIHGDGAELISPIMESGKVDVLAFIGSSRVADILKKQHPHPHRMRSILGLEAKNMAVITPEADLKVAVRECVAGALTFNGQRCTGTKIIFMHTSHEATFLPKLCEAVNALSMGMPWKVGVQITPLPETDKVKWMNEYIEDAEKLGAKVVNVGGGGYLHSAFHPAVLYPVAPEARLYREEQFGPLIPVVPYTHEEEIFEYIATSNYGQQASIYGTNPERVGRLIDALSNQVCRININSQCQRGPDYLPFTGRKDSAEGTLSVQDALRCFSIRSLVATQPTEANKGLITKIVDDHHSRFLHTSYLL